MDFCEKMREERKKRGLSQKELGKKIGMSQQMIAQYENGNRNPKMETIEKIANALEVPTFNLVETKSSVSGTDYFGKLMWKNREKQGLSREQLAEMAGISQQMLTQYENGYIGLEFKIIIRIATILKIHVSDLGYVDPEPVRLRAKNNNEESLLFDFRNLNEKGQERAIEQVELLTKIEEYRKKE